MSSLSILVSGSSGLIGSELCKSLKAKGHHITRLVRKKTDDPYSIVWNPAVGFEREKQNLENFDAVIHLAGSVMGNRRWTKELKKEIKDSRVISTEILSEAFALSKRKPKVFICASATGYYGSRGDEDISETADKGTGFLSDLTEEWEKATRAVGSEEVRVVNLRSGLVLSTKGGAFKKMLPVFKIGLGGKLGDGFQFVPWITLEDEVHAIEFILENKNIFGPVNLVSPNPITNKQLTKVIARVLKRPAVLPLPRFLLKTVAGEMAEELLLSGAKVFPKKLIAAGFKFRHPELEGAIKHMFASST